MRDRFFFLSIIVLLLFTLNVNASNDANFYSIDGNKTSFENGTLTNNSDLNWAVSAGWTTSTLKSIEGTKSLIITAGAVSNTVDLTLKKYQYMWYNLTNNTDYMQISINQKGVTGICTITVNGNIGHWTTYRTGYVNLTNEIQAPDTNIWYLLKMYYNTGTNKCNYWIYKEDNTLVAYEIESNPQGVGTKNQFLFAINQANTSTDAFANTDSNYDASNFPLTKTLVTNLTADFNYDSNTISQVLTLIDNSTIDANWSVVDWNWLVNGTTTGIADADANTTTFSPIELNIDYNICLSVAGWEDANHLNIVQNSVCKSIIAWDTISPTLIADINYTMGFTTNFDINYSLQCLDNEDTINYQIIKNDTNYLYNSTDANASIKTEVLTLTSGSNANLTFNCIDATGNTATYTTETLYAVLFRLVNEATGAPITSSQISTDFNIVRIYTPDGNYSFNAKNANSTTINFFSPIKELYFELGYKDTSQTSINRQIDFSLLNDLNIGVCVPLFQTFYQQRFVANSAREMVLQNNVSNCYVVASTLSYVYDTGYSITTYTIPKPYYLHIWIDSVKTFLALIDGSVATQYNLDAIAFSRTAFDIVVGQDTIGFAPLINTVTNQYDTNTLQIYYKSYTQDNTQTNFIIKNGSTTIWNYTEYSSADEFLVNFYWEGLGISDQNVLELIVTTTNSAGTTTSKSYYFTTYGNYYPNEGANGWVVIVASLFFLFGITLVAAGRAFGIFGIIICIICLAITAVASGAWWVSLIQAIFLMCLIYIVMMGRNTAGNFA